MTLVSLLWRSLTELVSMLLTRTQPLVPSP